MKFFRLDLLTLLISLFILNSCKNQDSVGLGINSTNQLNSNLVDTSTIVINTDTIGSLVTSGVTKNPLAYFVDPVFGTTVSNLATDLNLPGQTGFIHRRAAPSRSTRPGLYLVMLTVFMVIRSRRAIRLMFTSWPKNIIPIRPIITPNNGNTMPTFCWEASLLTQGRTTP